MSDQDKPKPHFEQLDCPCCERTFTHECPPMSDQDKPTESREDLERHGEEPLGWKPKDDGMARAINAALAEREKKLSNLKCPTCGYQLVALDNDELAKLTEKAAYHELRQQLAAERDDRISWQELYEKAQEQLAAEQKKHESSRWSRWWEFMTTGIVRDERRMHEFMKQSLAAEREKNWTHEAVAREMEVEIQQLHEQLAAEYQRGRKDGGDAACAFMQPQLASERENTRIAQKGARKQLEETLQLREQLATEREKIYKALSIEKGKLIAEVIQLREQLKDSEATAKRFRREIGEVGIAAAKVAQENMQLREQLSEKVYADCAERIVELEAANQTFVDALKKIRDWTESTWSQADIAAAALAQWKEKNASQ